MTQINLIITLNIDKSLTYLLKTVKLGNQFDNLITKINFIIPTEYNDILYKYCIIKDPYDHIIIKQLDINNSFIVDNNITNLSGNFLIMLLFSNTEVTSALDLDNEGVVLTTDYLNAIVNDNFLENISTTGIYVLPQSVFNTFSVEVQNILNTYRLK